MGNAWRAKLLSAAYLGGRSQRNGEPCCDRITALPGERDADPYGMTNDDKQNGWGVRGDAAILGGIPTPARYGPWFVCGIVEAHRC